MTFEPLSLPGAFIVKPERHEDERGFFERLFCREEFSRQGLVHDWVQINVSCNKDAATLRGMHYQAPPHGEVKLVRCTRGSIYDVVLDLRADSPRRGQWRAVTLSAANGWSVYIPMGLAHGFQTLEPATEVLYLMSTPYRPEAARTIRWDDPHYAIQWPAAARRIISDRDRLAGTQGDGGNAAALTV